MKCHSYRLLLRVESSMFMGVRLQMHFCCRTMHPRSHCKNGVAWGIISDVANLDVVRLHASTIKRKDDAIRGAKIEMDTM